MKQPSDLDVIPVAIIGGGVVGLSMAVALARQNIRSVVLERAEAPNGHPRAHVANSRTLELFRLWGVEEEVRRAGLSPAANGNFVWLTAIAGTQLGRISYERADERFPVRESATLTPEVSCAQDVIEGILRRRLVELTGHDVRYGTPALDLIEHRAGYVELTLGGGSPPLRARYAIAADGASSRTRDRLGLAMEGPTELARFVSIYLRADLSRWTEPMPAVLYWIVNRHVQGVFIAMDGRRRYVFHLRMDPTRETIADYTHGRCRDLVRRAIGVEASIEIREVSQWTMSGQVAGSYRSGNVFLVGDSAHRFPPTGGFGMNTGIQDAHNLAWKLAGVLEGWAPPLLLDTYEAERRPVAEANRSRSVSNFLRLETLASWSPDPVPIITRLESPGLVGENERKRFRAEVERQRDHFDKLDLELGFAYRAGALAADHAASDSCAAPLETKTIARATLGARMPLVRLSRPNGNPVATTDLFERTFVLLANGSSLWTEPAAALTRQGIPVECLEVGTDLLDPAGEWSTVSDTRLGGALLVRPDGHVAFHAAQPPTDPGAALSSAVRTILEGGRGH